MEPRRRYCIRCEKLTSQVLYRGLTNSVVALCHYGCIQILTGRGGD